MHENELVESFIQHNFTMYESQCESLIMRELFDHNQLEHLCRLICDCIGCYGLSRVLRKLYAKTKAQISCAVTAQLISAFVFATPIAQPLFFLNSKFQASIRFPRLYRPVCVGPGRKPQRPVFSHCGSFSTMLQVCIEILRCWFMSDPAWKTHFSVTRLIQNSTNEQQPDRVLHAP